MCSLASVTGVKYIDYKNNNDTHISSSPIHHSNQVVNDEVLETMLKEICRALVEADVNVKVVSTMRKAIKDKVNLEEAAAGLNRRKMIQRAVMEELVKLVDSGTKPYQMKKGMKIDRFTY